MPQPRPTSSATGKAQGTCSVCHTLHYLHLKDGCVHVHGERGNRCPGSNQPPLSASQALTASATNVCLQPGGGGPPQSDRPSGSVSVLLSNPYPSHSIHCLEHRAIIKHIPRTARSSCASHLANLFKLVSSKPDSVEAWQALFNWPSLVLALPKRGGKRHNLTAIIKKRLLDLPT